MVIFLLSIIGIGNSLSQYIDNPPFKGINNVKITLDIKGMDILDVLKLISMRSGLSIATSPRVRGTVTIFLKDVNVWDAFEILIAANDLAYEVKRNMLMVMTAREYVDKTGRPFFDPRRFKIIKLKHIKAESAAKAVDKLKSPLGKLVVDNYSNTLVILDAPETVNEISQAIKKFDVPLETRIVQLNYANVKDLKDKVSDLITENIGTIKFDEKANRVVITDFPGNARYIERIVKTFDKRPLEVLIEAKIIEITLSRDYTAGVDWHAVLGSEFGAAYKGVTPKEEEVYVGKIELGEKALGGVVDKAHEYSVLLALFNKFGHAEVLSTPRITVLNNQEASILVGKKQPIIQLQSQAVQGSQYPIYSYTVTYQDVGVKLHVTPTISDEGYITMKIKPEVSSIPESIPINLGSGETKTSTEIPVVATTEAETTIIVKDSATVVLGGLMKEENTEERGEVPGLSKIPGLGNLFKSKKITKEKKELVVLLTPRIVSGEGITKEAESYKKKAELKEQPIPSKKYEERSLLGKYMPKETSKGKISKEEEKQAYSEYYLKIAQKIINYMKENYLDIGIRGKINVVFMLDNNGNIIGKPAVIGDVEPSVKDLALSIIRQSAPFPEFPPNFKKRRETFNILLNFGGKK
jgi:type II secretory pathway component GspD/PulD (secretin)